MRKNRYDYIEEVHKFNPYHGYHGHFSAANAATSMTLTTNSKAGQKAIANIKEREKAKQTQVPKLSYDRLPLSTLWGNGSMATPAEKKQKRDTVKRFISEAKVGNVYATGTGVGSSGSTFEIVQYNRSPNKMGIKDGSGRPVALSSTNLVGYIKNGAHLIAQK